ncbi:MAG TPA: xanthine dehydrogenase family protein molybdopterin-binding subunit, partial [Kofleriaceae bacterium]|nr:xanthine dehydrogenase family protein molybdopterin-binding subunit [Kofleriaceae bacterium]
YEATGDFRPNAWLRITHDDRIVFTLDRVEMGQGTMTSHATLIGEELEVDPSKIEVALAEAGRAYVNSDLGSQVTGGSTSVKTSWEPLRRAGATAREMLRRGAASAWGVAVAECVAKDGVVTHTPTGRKATYGALAEAASRQDVPDVTLKDPKDWRWIGKEIDRVDARMKIDGSGVYGIDVRLPDMVIAVVIRPPNRGASLARFEATAARAKRGVVDVFAIDGGVAVLAKTYWQARTAADLVTTTWNDDGLRASTDEMLASYDELSRRPAKPVREDGDADAALARAAKTIEATYVVPYLAHATMEPQNATARVTGDRVEVWAPTQAPGVAQWEIAEALGFDARDVEVHTTLVGGGFGRRLWQDYAVEAALIAYRAKRPVKVVWSREDDLANDFYRPMALSRFRGGVDARGRVIAWHHRLVTQSIVAHEGADFVGAVFPDGTPRALRRWAASSLPRTFARGPIADSTSIEGAVDLPYAIPDLRMELATVETEVPVGFWRSVGHSHTTFVVEAFLDELIHLGGGDAYRARRDLLKTNPRLRAVLDLAATQAGWGSAPPAGVGRGISVHESFHSRVAHVIEASADKVHRVVSAIDCGRVVNPQLVRQQLESAIIFGLSAALKQQITFDHGRVRETNFRDFKLLRMYECPAIEIHIVPSDEAPTGVGEPGVPPVAPALAGAIFAATGNRIRTLPIQS